MLRSFALLLLTLLPATAHAYEPVTDRGRFLDLMQGRALHIGLYALTINVEPNGTLRGRALGSDVSGTWDWKDGYFCREILWSDVEIPHNCQLVEQNADKLRFTSDRGAGRSAAFTLR